MSKNYSRLTYQNRIGIYYLLKQRMSVRSIARELNVSPSTISREIQRNRSGTAYYPNTAQRKTQKRWHRLTRKLDSSSELRYAVFTRLRKQWSPEQISASLKRCYEDRSMHISPESIYTYLYVLPRGELKKELLGHLRQFRTKRKERGKHHAAHGPIPNLISIHERPIEVEDRTIPGHWEGDLIIGDKHQSALGTLVERTTRTTLLIPLQDKDAASVRRAFAKHVKRLPRHMKLSMTYDRGGEMAQHRLFTEETKMKVYFADPQSPWQRGTNENTNGLIRQYFPKGTDFKKVSRSEYRKVQDLLNERPRKVLDWRSPAEAMDELLR
ncbi:MAG: IS30 family transposase [Porticoccus sp.]|nr:IS30 family transposase [Porticoccus sp.]